MNFSFNRDRHGLGVGRRPTTPSATSVAMAIQREPSQDDIHLAASTATGEGFPPDDNREALDLSSTEYARVRKEVMQLISDLRSLGAETMMDLPSIAVIGGQSGTYSYLHCMSRVEFAHYDFLTGKSSLVEVVTGVNVPRDSGTCTRCPTECTMSSSATTWSCKIKLRFDYDSFGRPTLQQKDIPFGPTITDKDDVDIWLRRAQAAILNPDLTPESFHRRSIQDLKDLAPTNTLKFSRNVISVFIEDPNATDLSFVDLPGLIQNEDTEVVDLVRQLTESYISRPNTIILTTIPMSDDMQNQQSVKLARQADPDGERTIGILTKPDTLGEGAVNSRQQWLNVIEGREHELKHGYYCVRLPDDAERAQRLSRSALQRIATDFFDSTAPWNGVVDRGRFGIPAFVTDISVLLVGHIKKVIPQLRQDVDQLLISCLDDISTLPKPLEADPQIEVLARVNAFCDAFKSIVSGSSSDKSFVQRNKAHYTIFAQDIRGTSPDFRPFEEPTQYMSIDVLDTEERAEVRNKRVRTMGVHDVRKTITESIAWELPGNIPYEAKTRLINQFTDLWSTPAEKCVASINNVLDDVMQQLAKTHFGRFKVLLNMISGLIRPDIEEHKNRALVAIKETLKLELIPTYTQSLKDFQELRERWLIKYRKARRNPEEYRARIPQSWPQPSSPVDSTPSKAKGKGDRSGKRAARSQVSSPVHDGLFYSSPADPVLSSADSQALDYLAQAGYKGLTVDDLVCLSPRDQFKDELVVMADVRAYFTIACKRIIDHVPLKIHQCLHQALADKLSVNLLQRLIVDTTSAGNFADRMKELVSEDPAIETKRVGLEATRVRLQEMKKKLANFAA